jgi:uncharacterized protein YchJ
MPMETIRPLPAYSDDALAAFSAETLLELLARDEDRVPRNVIDACAARGEAFVQALEAVLENYRSDGERTLGEWWRLLHAVMILGLIPSAGAGRLLVRFMRRMSELEDDSLQDWLAGYWPALFRNKPAAVAGDLRALRDDRGLDWYIRAGAKDATVAIALREGPAALERVLDELAAAAADEMESWDYRMFAANTLLDFPRPRHRLLLDTIAGMQPDIGAIFHRDDVARAYAGTQDAPDWERRENPWEFYEPQAIAERQQRWEQEDQQHQEKEDSAEDDGYSAYVPDTYVRAAPKVGRNDPCPCGSGKKYKRCCLGAASSLDNKNQ